MNLHRAGRKADWESVKPRHRTMWQRLAVRTSGTVTPGNLLTVLGIILTARGLYNIDKGRTGKGLTQLAAGGLADVLDGLAADKSGTKSPLGEAVDASADKLAMLETVGMLTHNKTVPMAAGSSIGIQNAANAVIAVAAKTSGRRLQASRQGKTAMALQRAAIVLYVTARILKSRRRSRAARWVRGAGHLCTLGGTICGCIATIGYVLGIARTKRQK